MLCLIVPLLIMTTPAVAEVRGGRVLRWHTMPSLIIAAIDDFRQSDHPFAEAMAHDMDGMAQGRNTERGRPFNFDPSRNLGWRIVDLNGDGRPEVFLMFSWAPLSGSRTAHGVLMQRIGERWRDICDFDADSWPLGRLTILRQRTLGWRHFRTNGAAIAWRRAAGRRGAMECL